MRKGLLVVAVLAMGCSSQVNKPVIERGGPGTDRNLPAGSATVGKPDLGRKKVRGKEEPITLVAVDGTRCTVNEDRFREVSIGELVWCSWK